MRLVVKWEDIMTTFTLGRRALIAAVAAIGWQGRLWLMAIRSWTAFTF